MGQRILHVCGGCALLVLAGVAGSIGCGASGLVSGGASGGATVRGPEGSGASSFARVAGELGGLENVLVAAPGVYSGSGPEGEAAFDALAGLGVRTVVSVDGARPALELARERGMRYVHVPVGYDGIGSGEAAALARAVRELPGPVYIHCHHGEHRGPAATAAALAGLGRMTGTEATALLEAAGTSPGYPGLWATARRAQRCDEAALSSAALPEYAPVSGLVEAMVAIDGSWERLGLARRAGWRSPASHPDVAPGAEAGILADHLRVLAASGEAGEIGAAFVEAMRESAARAGELERAVVGGGALDEIEGRYEELAASCRDCHRRWRD